MGAESIVYTQMIYDFLWMKEKPKEKLSDFLLPLNYLQAVFLFSAFLYYAYRHIGMNIHTIFSISLYHVDLCSYIFCVTKKPGEKKDT